MVKAKDPYGRNTSTVFRRKCKELKQSAQGSVCCICFEFIDRSLPPELSNTPDYWTVEHDPPLSQGGHLIKDIKGPAHRRCNSVLGRQLQLANTVATIGDDPASREW